MSLSRWETDPLRPKGEVIPKEILELSSECKNLNLLTCRECGYVWRYRGRWCGVCCPKCGVSTHFPEYGKEYYQTHKEEIKAYMKQHYQTHKEEITKRHKAYYQTHKEEWAKYLKQYRQTHKEEISKQKKTYYQTHKEARQEYYQNNKEERKKYQKEYSAKKKAQSLNIQREAIVV